MNKKILIGSLIAITILIAVSFTSVVGYRSVDSDVKASPLFNIRSNKAIDEKNEELSCEYVGKGEDINIQISKRNETKVMVLKAIEKLIQMDEDKLKKQMDFIIGYIDIDKLNLPKKLNRDKFQQLMGNSEFLKVGEEWTNDFLGAWGFDCLWAIFVFTILAILATPLIIVSIPVILVSVLLVLFIGSIAILGGVLWVFITSVLECDITFGPLSHCPNTLCGC